MMKFGNHKPSLGKHKRQLQTKMAAMLAGLFLFWGFLFLPEALFIKVRDAVGAWGELGARLGISSFLVFSVRWVIFAQDSLPTGNTKWSKYFRSLFVDAAIMTKYGCSQKQAVTLWFQYFNRWERASDVYSQYHRMTFSRTYACRLVYHLRQWLLYFAVLGSLTLMFNLLFIDEFANWAVCAMSVVAAVGLSAFLTYANKIPDGDTDIPTGCWKKYKEIAEIQSVLLDRDILKHADTYDEAWDLVSTWPIDDREAPQIITGQGRSA